MWLSACTVCGSYTHYSPGTIVGNHLKEGSQKQTASSEGSSQESTGNNVISETCDPSSEYSILRLQLFHCSLILEQQTPLLWMDMGTLRRMSGLT